jgi:hypothetical protein
VLTLCILPGILTMLMRPSRVAKPMLQPSEALPVAAE